MSIPAIAPREILYILLSSFLIFTQAIDYGSYRHDDIPKDLKHSDILTNRDILERTSANQSPKFSYTLQEGTEHLLEYAALLRAQILDTFGKLLYEHYDDFAIVEVESLYRIYQETLERRYNIFELVPSILRNPDTRPSKICNHIYRRIRSCLKECSNVCRRISKHDFPHPQSLSTSALNITYHIYRASKMSRHYPRGISLPAILRYVKKGTLVFTPTLFSGLLHNLRYDSFDDEVRASERELAAYLLESKDEARRNFVHTEMPLSLVELRNVRTVGALLKLYLSKYAARFPDKIRDSAEILGRHIVGDVDGINENIHLLANVYYNDTIHLKYLFDLVLPTDVLDDDVNEAKNYLVERLEELDFVNNYLKIEKYHQRSPDELLMEIVGQLREIGFAVDIATSLRAYARFWHKSRMVENLNDLLKLFDAYENLRRVPQYESLMAKIDSVKASLWDSKNVSVEILCNAPRACLRLGLQVVSRCGFVSSNVKKLIGDFLDYVTAKGAPLDGQCPMPMDRPVIPKYTTDIPGTAPTLPIFRVQKTRRVHIPDSLFKDTTNYSVATTETKTEATETTVESTESSSSSTWTEETESTTFTETTETDTTTSEISSTESHATESTITSTITTFSTDTTTNEDHETTLTTVPTSSTVQESTPMTQESTTGEQTTEASITEPTTALTEEDTEDSSPSEETTEEEETTGTAATHSIVVISTIESVRRGFPERETGKKTTSKSTPTTVPSTSQDSTSKIHTLETEITQKLTASTTSAPTSPSIPPTSTALITETKAPATSTNSPSSGLTTLAATTLSRTAIPSESVAPTRRFSGTPSSQTESTAKSTAQETSATTTTKTPIPSALTEATISLPDTHIGEARTEKVSKECVGGKQCSCTGPECFSESHKSEGCVGGEKCGTTDGSSTCSGEECSPTKDCIDGDCSAEIKLTKVNRTVLCPKRRCKESPEEEDYDCSDEECETSNGDSEVDCRSVECLSTEEQSPECGVKLCTASSEEASSCVGEDCSSQRAEQASTAAALEVGKNPAICDIKDPHHRRRLSRLRKMRRIGALRAGTTLDRASNRSRIRRRGRARNKELLELLSILRGRRGKKGGKFAKSGRIASRLKGTALRDVGARRERVGSAGCFDRSSRAEPANQGPPASSDRESSAASSGTTLVGGSLSIRLSLSSDARPSEGTTVESFFFWTPRRRNKNYADASGKLILIYEGA
ncbi:hypothetical protein KM043_005508 [Ampulex compressa]|nr:hypothetical protein KM043_005508 [Ampulex compressa]